MREIEGFILQYEESNDPDDLRIAADWAEENDLQIAAEWLRWMADHNSRPLYRYMKSDDETQWVWAPTGILYPRKDSSRLPNNVTRHFPRHLYRTSFTHPFESFVHAFTEVLRLVEENSIVVP